MLHNKLNPRRKGVDKEPHNQAAWTKKTLIDAPWVENKIVKTWVQKKKKRQEIMESTLLPTSNQVLMGLSPNQLFDNKAQMLITQRTEFLCPYNNKQLLNKI